MMEESTGCKLLCETLDSVIGGDFNGRSVTTILMPIAMIMVLMESEKFSPIPLISANGVRYGYYKNAEIIYDDRVKIPVAIATLG